MQNLNSIAKKMAELWMLVRKTLSTVPTSKLKVENHVSGWVLTCITNLHNVTIFVRHTLQKFT